MMSMSSPTLAESSSGTELVPLPLGFLMQQAFVNAGHRSCKVSLESMNLDLGPGSASLVNHPCFAQ
jgi:hypothetical protein